MKREKAYAVPNRVTPNKPILFDEKVCIGCNRCVENCLMDVFIPNPEKGKPPIVLYPDECWYEGSCVQECPLREKGAIQLNWPLIFKMRWKKKSTDEHFRLGMPDPPAPNPRPPAGGWDAKSGLGRKKPRNR